MEKGAVGKIEVRRGESQNKTYSASEYNSESNLKTTEYLQG